MDPASTLATRMLDRLGRARVSILLARADLRVIVTAPKAVCARKMLDVGTLWPGGPTIKWAHAWRLAATRLPARSGWARYALARAKIATLRAHLLCALQSSGRL